ncbi:MAG: FAD-dependent oxidoreductase, partial [Desulfobacterales bacterium]|nr:FAD-dependent oxidoreductase [Desulfobacterales bacterium]
MKKPFIGIIGGGLAGLAAAWRIHNRGARPLVFESENHVGGRARSISDAGAVHDLGAWTFTAKGAVRRFVAEIGLEEEMVAIPTTVGRHVHGRLRVSNLRDPLSLIQGAFTPRELLTTTRALWMARAIPGKTPDEPAARWAAGRFPREFIRDVLEPLAGLYFLQDPRTLSRDALLGTLLYLSRVRLHSFRSGMGRLTSFLAERLPVRRGARVEKIERIDSVDFDSEGARVTGRGFSERVDGLIIATPLPEAARLLSPYLSQSGGSAPAQWKYASTLVVRLLYRGPWHRAALQVLPPRRDGWCSCGLTMERAKYAGRVPDGCELAAMYARPDRVAELSALP